MIESFLYCAKQRHYHGIMTSECMGKHGCCHLLQNVVPGHVGNFRCVVGISDP